ncbi:D-isomer specific 2-hydroxyacid dehydrogenase [Xylariomycetidae sp. FL0641]|nr:D-isomer specific 2-hydroxyacid dehydrogenase [Xylariomycetidae sp. FL0641]
MSSTPKPRVGCLGEPKFIPADYLAKFKQDFNYSVAAMKDGAFVVNTARGAVVDEDALIKALESGKVTRAGLDVFVGEPNANPYVFQSDKVVRRFSPIWVV